MGTKFFIRRFLAAICIAFAALFAADLLKGHALQAALAYAAIWGTITAVVYVAALAYRLRKGAVCEPNAVRPE